MARLSGTRAVVTGSGRGIGRAIALSYAAEGAAVVVSARSRDQVEAVAREITDQGGRASALTTDIADQAQVDELAAAAPERLGGPVDVLVNNAGTYIPNRFLDYGMEQWAQMLDVNVLGTVRVTRALLPPMLEAGAGRIVNMASTAGKWGSLYQAAYNVSKHGIVGLTRCLALETAKQGVRVNAICPGWVETELIDRQELSRVYGVPAEEVVDNLLERVPIGRFVTVEEVAELAVYLASPASEGMTGQALTISGGMILI
jgi:3-hydroxybutyrate dehydrogenase